MFTKKGKTTRYKHTHLRARKTPGTCRPGHRCEGPCGPRVLDGLRQRLRGLLAEGPCDRRDGDLRRCGCAPGFSCLGKPGGLIAHELKGKPNEVDIRPGLRAPGTNRGAGTQLHAPGRAPGRSPRLPPGRLHLQPPLPPPPPPPPPGLQHALLPRGCAGYLQTESVLPPAGPSAPCCCRCAHVCTRR